MTSLPPPTAHNAATNPLMQFMQDGKSRNFFDKLYESEAVCLGLFRLLPPISRQIILNLLWLSNEMKAKDLKLFLGLKPDAPHDQITTPNPLLTSLLILHPVKHKGLLYYTLHEGFKAGFRGSLTGGGKTGSFGTTYQAGDREVGVEVEVEELIRHGDTNWEALLKYMVSSQQRISSTYSPSPKVLDLLIRCGLMGYLKDDHEWTMNVLKITSKGFQFLLEDRAAQVWQVLMYYIEQGMKDGVGYIGDGVDVLKLLFSLSNMQLGRAYDASKLPPAQRQILSDLEPFGLIYPRASTAQDQFYPTRLATTLCSGTNEGDEGVLTNVSEGRKGFLVLETNYKVYAYTSNELEIAILNLFIDIRTRYPNLIVGRLERDTVKEAMKNGITANQIISYLTTHAHPQMYKNTPLLPITVVDQLHLWDRERNRLEKNTAAMFKFWRKDFYEDCLEYSKTIAALLWTTTRLEPNGADRMFSGLIIVHESLSKPFRDYVDARRNELSSVVPS